jgi:hypothetical protein
MRDNQATHAAASALVVALATVAYLVASCSASNVHRVIDVAPDACDLLAPEVPAEVCKKAHDAADLLDKILAGKRAAAARPAVSK